MKGKNLDINSIREKDFTDYSLKDFVSSSELELYNVLYKEYFEEIKNYLLAKTLKIIRSHFSLTQKEFAQKIGKSEILIRKYEKGTIKINNNIILSIIKILSLNFPIFEKFLKNALHDFIYSGEYEECINNCFSVLLSFESFKNLNDISESFIKGELDILKFVFQNILDTFFYSDVSKNNKIDWEKFDKKVNIKKLQTEIAFIEYLEKNNYIMSEFSETEVIFKKDDCFYEISSEKLSEISKQVSTYTEFLLSNFKTQK